MKDWMYNEFTQVGVDYTENENTDIYDDQMEQFRDYEKEVQLFVDRLGISDPGSLTVIDIGCGTGAFAIHAAGFFKKVYAVDVSKQMLQIASAKAEAKNITNITFVNSGFLQFSPPEACDVVFTKWAHHHLPDYWKQVSLLNINKMLKPGGVLFLADLVFTFETDYEHQIETMLGAIPTDIDTNFVEETKTHIRDEYSTFDWILRGLIERAGFTIEESNTENSLLSEYFCRKTKEL